MNNSCRTCTLNAGIFDVYSANSAILNKLELCTPIQIRKDDPYSKRICKACYDKLEIAYNFYKMCDENAEKLEELSSNNVSKGGGPIKNDVFVESAKREPVKIKFDNGASLCTLIKKVKKEPESLTTSQTKSTCLSKPVQSQSVKPVREIKEEQCEFCTLKFPSMPSLYRHYQLGHSELEHECLVCGIKMKGVLIYQSHMKTHERFVCEFCGLQMKSKHGMKKHVENVHTKGSVKSCEVCNKLLPSASAYKIHYQQLHGELIHTCEFCGKVLSTPRSLQMHIRRHKSGNDSDGSIICSFCSRTFEDKESKHKHELTHNDFDNGGGYELPIEAKPETNHNLFNVASLS